MKVTNTGVVAFTPLELGTGVMVAITAGGVLSRRTVSVFAVSTLPALSVAKKLTVVVPSVVMVTKAEFPATTLAPVCAPVRLTLICFTPLPLGLSIAVTTTVGLELFHLPLGAGCTTALLAGGIVSVTAGAEGKVLASSLNNAALLLPALSPCGPPG